MKKRIKDYVLDHLLNQDEIGYKPYDFMAGNPSYFNINYLSMLKSEDVKLKRRYKDQQFILQKITVFK